MDILKLTTQLGNAFEVKKVDADIIQIKTSASLPNTKPIILFLEKRDKFWILTDKKQILKYMSAVYELKATDVKNCIAAVLKIYKFKMQSGEIFVEVLNESMALPKLFDFVMCIAQLVNMYAFFDNPT